MDGIEIRYAGVLLGRATQVRDQSPAGLFVGFAEPLPVGTPIALKGADGEQTGRVIEVVESADPTVAGMRIQYGAAVGRSRAEAPPAASAPPPAASAPPPAVETPAAAAAPPPAAETLAEAAASAAAAHHVDGENGSAAHGSGAHEGDQGGRRKRRRK